jgi:hypothetical protein
MKRGSTLTKRFLCLLAIVPAFWASTAFGDTLNVPSADYPNIQKAIDATLPGDTVSVGPGTYTGSGNVNLLILGRSIKIEGSGRDSCIIDCEGSGRAFTFTGVETSDSVLSGFTIKGGKVSDNGGAILCDNGASPTIQECVITGNEADQYGGGIACLNASSPSIRDCDIEDNSSGFGGGGLYIENSSPKLKECSISNNDGGYFGAGVYVTGSSEPKLLSCLIARNSAIYYGGGIFCSEASSPKIINCTVADNLVDDPDYSEGGGIYSGSSSPQITNSIFWRDAAVAGPEIYLAAGSVLVLKNSDVKGGKAGVIVDNSTLDWDDATNLDADPLFAGGDDYHLKADSPCIDKGTTDLDNGDLPDVDFDGEDRVLNDFPDMGADETETTSKVIVHINIRPESRHNKIDLRCRGTVSVAVLSSKDFDARMIDRKSVLFAGAAPVRSVLHDVDRDYDLDMLFLFRIQDLDLDEDSTEATLAGVTIEGESFEGTDSVTIYKPKCKAKSWWKWARIKHMFHKDKHHYCNKHKHHCSK